MLTADGQREQYQVNLGVNPQTVIPLQGPKEGRVLDLSTAMADGGFINLLAGSGDRIVAN